MWRQYLISTLDIRDNYRHHMGMAAFAKGPTQLLISKNRKIFLSYQEMKGVKVHDGKVGEAKQEDAKAR